MELSDLCIHKDIEKAKEFVQREYGILPDMVKHPLTYCEKCDGRSDRCFYYYRLQDIKRREENGKEKE
jgi:hypothetical protein